MSNEPTNERKYGGYTIKQIKEIIASSDELGESVDDLCGGDGAASCNIIRHLVMRVERLESVIFPFTFPFTGGSVPGDNAQ